jgi:hypothetical protein
MNKAIIAIMIIMLPIYAIFCTGGDLDVKKEVPGKADLRDEITPEPTFKDFKNYGKLIAAGARERYSELPPEVAKLVAQVRIDYPLPRLDRGLELLYYIPEVEKAVPYLIESAKESNYPYVRENAIDVLGILKEKAVEAVPLLIEALDHEDYTFLRSSAAFALARIGTEEVEEHLIRKLDSDIRSSAIWALGIMLSDSFFPLDRMIELLSDERAIVRMAAVEELRDWGPGVDEALPKLRELAENDEDDEIRRAAGEAIKNIESNIEDRKEPDSIN